MDENYTPNPNFFILPKHFCLPHYPYFLDFFHLCLHWDLRVCSPWVWSFIPNQSKKYGGRLTLSPCRFFPMSRLIRFSKYVHEHLSRKRKKFSLVCGLNDLFSNITRISKLVGQEVKKRRRRHSCRAAVIGKTGKNVDLPIFYEKEHREGISDAMLTRRSCLSIIYGCAPDLLNCRAH